MGKLIVSLSPHAHGSDTIERNMYGVIIALMPALLVSFYFFGLGSVVVTATSVAACVFFEWAISKYILKLERNTIMDGSAIHHRCAFCYRCSQDDFRRSGQQPLQSSPCGPCSPLGGISCTDDNLAEGWPTWLLSRCRNGSHSAFYHEVGYQE